MYVCIMVVKVRAIRVDDSDKREAELREEARLEDAGRRGSVENNRWRKHLQLDEEVQSLQSRFF